MAAQWHFYQITFDLGLQGTDPFPEDVADLLDWLVKQEPKYVGGLKIEPAIIVTAPG